jgi:hypothetical protein
MDREMTKRIQATEWVVSASVITKAGAVRDLAAGELALVATRLAAKGVDVSFSAQELQPSAEEPEAFKPEWDELRQMHAQLSDLRALPLIASDEYAGGVLAEVRRILGVPDRPQDRGALAPVAEWPAGGGGGGGTAAPGTGLGSHGSGQQLQAHVLTDRACRSRAGDAPIVRDGDRCYLCRPSSNGG